MSPRMIVVAGPPGRGKSSIFPVSDFGVPYFNADDRAAELNGGSCAGIWIHDNSPVGGPPLLVLEAEKNAVRYLADNPPGWLASALDLS